MKEVFYTYNEKTNSLYAIFPRYPDSLKIVLRNVELPRGTNVTFLSTAEKVIWATSGGDTEVALPGYNPNKIKAPYAYALKIENFGKYVPKPKIKIEYLKNSFEPTVSITGGPLSSILYSLDHADAKSNPDRKSTRLNSSHRCISYAVFCLKKKKKNK